MKLLPLCRHQPPPTFCATWALRRMRPVPLVALFLLFLILMLILSGCTIGPTVEVRHVLIHPGQPLRVMTNVSVSGERLDGGGAADHDIGGWVAMPPDHWVVIENIIRESVKKNQPPAVPVK